MSVRELSGKQVTAAQHVAEDLLIDAEIAKLAGVSRETIRKWKVIAEFKTEVDNRRAAIREETMVYGVANIGSQIKRLNETRLGLLEVIRQRKAWAYEGFPGEDTGLVVRVPKEHGSTQEVDTSILAELRDIELQALKITGQLNTKITGAGAVKMIIGVALEDI